MRKLIVLVLIVTLASCSSKKVTDTSKQLYQVLVSSEYGGGSFEFYETITEEREFKMLLGDDEIKKFVKPNDILTSNFILVNLGEKNNGGYSVAVDKIEELSDKIKISFKKIAPTSGTSVTMAITNPYCVVKINSKKPIEIIE